MRNLLFLILLSLFSHAVFAVDPPSSTECEKVNKESDPQPNVHEQVTFDEANHDSVALALARMEAQKKHEREKSQSIIETNRQELERVYPGAKVLFLAKGGESVVYSVEKPGEAPLAVKIPIKQARVSRVLLGYEQERKILEAAEAADPEGAKFLMTGKPGPRMNYHGIKIHPHEQAMGEMNLRELVQKELGPKTDPALMLRLWREMALGARAVARADFVHRDIKPANWIVRVGPDGQPHVYLSDFGLARVRGTDMSGEEIQGTFGFMSESQVQGRPPQRADDLYALMVSMKETLIGTDIWSLDPKKSENHIRLIEIDEYGRYPVLDGLPEATTRKAAPVLRDLMLKKYTTVDEVIAELDRAIAGLTP